MNNLLPILLGLSALIGSVIAPTLYVGGIKEVNAVQATEIRTLQDNYSDLRLEIKEMRTDTNKRLDALLSDRGIKLK